MDFFQFLPPAWLKPKRYFDFRALITTGSDGRVVTWDLSDGTGTTVEGEGHTNQVF